MSKSLMTKHAKGMVLLLLIVLLAGCGTQIPSGHRGVKYKKFGGGTEMGKIYQEGFNWHFPWNSIYVYQTQMQERKEAIQILSADGATIGMEMSVWFKPLDKRIDSLQVSIGPNYFNAVIAPALRGVSRTIVGQYKPEEIYSSKREEIASAILEQMREQMHPKFILIENIIVRDVVLPPKITEAINAKLAADQEQQKMEYTLLKEKQEAERKRIEAQGIADFQKIVSSGITETLLKWKGIEATENLANSPNSKVVIIGAGESGLPIILGSDR